QGHLHEIDDQLDIFRPITKWAHRVTKPGEIPEAVHEAFRHLKTGRPRPVELEIPPDTLMASDDITIVEPEEYPRPTGRASDLQRAGQLLAHAKHPAIVAGGGAVCAGASSELLDLAEYLQAPVLASRQGKSIIPNDHYLFTGVHFYVPDPWQRALNDADVILAVGTRFLVTGLELKPHQKVIQIDVDPDQFGRTHAVELGIEADAKASLAAILDQLKQITKPRESRRAEMEKAQQDFEKRIRSLVPEQTGILDAIQGKLDDDAIVISGMTNIGYWAHSYLSSKLPGTYITSSYFGTLGYGFPTALGAKVAMPDRQVVSINGDGGFLFNPQELSTAATYNIAAVTLVFNNGVFGASNWDQTHRFNRRYIGTELRNPDFMKLAEAFGVMGIRTAPDGLGKALRKALDANAPVLIEVPLPNLMPPFQIVE
ncbi:MAG: thiamine pyrophosphate-dependent enzyme, partial [Chloroflexi bacterium]|nr:thiamine pyrophosphate-dependent enzyme [Chloroflexota bacterium]